MLDSGDGLVACYVLLVDLDNVHAVFHDGLDDNMIYVVLACESEYV